MFPPAADGCPIENIARDFCDKNDNISISVNITAIININAVIMRMKTNYEKKSYAVILPVPPHHKEAKL